MSNQRERSQRTNAITASTTDLLLFGVLVVASTDALLH